MFETAVLPQLQYKTHFKTLFFLLLQFLSSDCDPVLVLSLLHIVSLTLPYVCVLFFRRVRFLLKCNWCDGDLPLLLHGV